MLVAVFLFRNKMAKELKRDFLDEDKVDMIMLALNATKLQSSNRMVTFILALNEAIEKEPDLSMKTVLALFKVIFKEEPK